MTKVATTVNSKSNKNAQKEEPKLEIINIREANPGDIVRYQSSKKPYIVAQKDLKADRPFVHLVSKTQQYKSYKEKFEVVRVAKGSGELPKTLKDKEQNEILTMAKAILKQEADTAKKAAAAAKKEEASKAEETKTSTTAKAEQKKADEATAQAKKDSK